MISRDKQRQRIRFSGRITTLLLLSALMVGCKAQQTTTNPLVGEWSAVLRVDGKTHQGAMHVTSDEQGGLSVSLDALDERVMGLKATGVSVHGNEVSFEVPEVNGKYLGTLSADGNTINGIWTKPPQPPSPMVITRRPDEPDDSADPP